MSDLPPLRHRVVRVVIRMGGTSSDAAKALGCTKRHAHHVAREIGWKFGGSIRVRLPA